MAIRPLQYPKNLVSRGRSQYGLASYYSNDQLYSIAKYGKDWQCNVAARYRAGARYDAFLASGLKHVCFPRRIDAVRALEAFEEAFTGNLAS